MSQPAISHTRLYSYLVTRHTGRTVRTSIEAELARFADGRVLAVLDLQHVELIDFSCADEVVAKLVTGPPPIEATRRFFLFRGISDRLSEPIHSALARQDLAAAAETIEGDPLVMGHIAPEFERAWRGVWALGRTAPPDLADHLSLGLDDTNGLLAELDIRGLVMRDGEHYVSFGWALRGAAAADRRGSAAGPGGLAPDADSAR